MRIVHLDSVGSTQDELVRRLRSGETIHAVSATEQTSGRGRFGRAWDSPPGESLALSVTVPAPAEMRSAPYIGMALAVGVAERYGVGVQWPNDVTSGGRKLAGILIEVIEVEGQRVLAIGIGVNLLQSSFPSSLAARATSVLLATGQRRDPKIEAKAIAELARLEAPSSWAELAARWARVDETAGKLYRAPGGPVGVARGVAPDGRLILEEARGDGSNENGARGTLSVAEAWFGPE